MRILLALVITGALVVTGCGDTSRPSAESRRAESTAVASDATARPGGIIEVRVTYHGDPVVETVRVNKDVEPCGREQRLEKVAVGPDRGLRDAVVSVVGPAGIPTGAPAERPTLDQKNCRFHPRVLAMTPGEIAILNSDGVLHNIHSFSTANPPINKAQPKFKKVITERFEQPEIIRVRCDVHSWMEGWIVVLGSPYFAVTEETGLARIDSVPAGAHTLEVWHPELGKHAKPVEVRVGEVTKVTFELGTRRT